MIVSSSAMPNNRQPPPPLAKALTLFSQLFTLRRSTSCFLSYSVVSPIYFAMSIIDCFIYSFTISFGPLIENISPVSWSINLASSPVATTMSCWQVAVCSFVCSRDSNIAAKIHNFCGFLSAPMAIFLLPQAIFVIVPRQMVDALRQSPSLCLTFVLGLSCYRRALVGP